MDRARVRRTILREGIRAAKAVRDATHTVHEVLREERQAAAWRWRSELGLQVPSSPHDEQIARPDHVDHAAPVGKLVVRGPPGGMALGRFRLIGDPGGAPMSVQITPSEIVSPVTGAQLPEVLRVQPSFVQVPAGTEEIVTVAVELPGDAVLGETFGLARARISWDQRHQDLNIVIVVDL